MCAAQRTGWPGPTTESGIAVSTFPPVAVIVVVPADSPVISSVAGVVTLAGTATTSGLDDVRRMDAPGLPVTTSVPRPPDESHAGTTARLTAPLASCSVATLFDGFGSGSDAVTVARM